jgi:hypothetical protein
MYNTLNQHLNVNKILTLEQFGFQKNCNTNTAIYSLTDNILRPQMNIDKWLVFFVTWLRLLNCEP